MEIGYWNLTQHRPASLAPQDGLQVLVMIKNKNNVLQFRSAGPCLRCIILIQMPKQDFPSRVWAASAVLYCVVTEWLFWNFEDIRGFKVTILSSESCLCSCEVQTM